MKSRVDTIVGRVDLNLLVIFEAIYRARNLTVAGRAVALSQPAMSRALSRLRGIFHDPLFVRLPRGLEPTPIADDLAPAIIEGLRTLRASLERRTFDPRGSTRVFRLGIGDIAEWVHLPQIRTALSQAAPHTRLNTVQIPATRLRDALGNGEVDVATGDYDLGARCRSVMLYESTYACVVRPDHPVIKNRLTLQQFKTAEHLLVVPGGAFRHGQIIERALTSRKINARIAVQISHFPGVLPLIAGSDLITTIPLRLAQAFRQFANIRILRPPISLESIPVCLYWHERFHRDPANEWLRGLYMKALRIGQESD